MRAIGKGSLASIIAIGLHVIRVLMWIAFSGATLAFIILPFVPPLARFINGYGGVDIDGGVELGDFFSLGLTFTTIAVMLFIVNRLLEIVQTLRFGSPFVKENAERFRGVGYALLIGEGAKFAFGLLALIYSAKVSINSSMITWLAIMAVFVLAEVFSEGARMKEEQDLTV